MNALPRFTLFYDGLNLPCLWEIGHYRKHLPSSTDYVDITQPSFDAAAYGLDSDAVQRVFHIKIGDEIRTGVDAFVTILAAITRYRWLARIVRSPLVQLLLRFAYAGICVVRPWLSRRPSRRPPTA